MTDTLASPPSEIITETDHDIPSAPPQLDPDTIDAPDWARFLIRTLLTGRDEEREQLRRIESNQRVQLREIRRVSRRVTEHDTEIGDLRRRVEDLEDWRDAEE